MHIALIVLDLGGGGAERSVLGLAEGLIKRGYRVDIILLRTGIQYREEVPKDTRLFIVENRPNESTENSAEILAPITRLRAPSRPFDWVRMANALNWDPLCLPGPSLVRQARAIAAYMDVEKPNCVLPSLSRPNIATLLACHFLT